MLSKSINYFDRRDIKFLNKIMELNMEGKNSLKIKFKKKINITSIPKTTMRIDE